MKKPHIGSRHTGYSALESRLVAAATGCSPNFPWWMVKKRRDRLTKLCSAGLETAGRSKGWICMPPGYTCSPVGSWRACQVYRWCPFCYVRNVSMEAYHRLRLAPADLQAWRFHYRDDVDFGQLDEYQQLGEPVKYGQPWGYFYVTTLTPGKQADSLALQHRAVFLHPEGGWWADYFRQRLAKHGPTDYTLLPRRSNQSLEDFVRLSFPYERRWFTCPAEEAVALIEHTKQRAFRLRGGGVLRGCRRKRQSGYFTTDDL